MIIGILKESGNENRVAMLPGEVASLKKLGVDVLSELHSGEKAFASDKDYEASGATVTSRKDVIAKSEMLLSVNPPLEDGIDSFSEGQGPCFVLNPVENKEWLEKIRLKGITVLALDLVPRTTRAQSMDILSSMATVDVNTKLLLRQLQCYQGFSRCLCSSRHNKTCKGINTRCRSCRITGNCGCPKAWCCCGGI